MFTSTIRRAIAIPLAALALGAAGVATASAAHADTVGAQASTIELRIVNQTNSTMVLQSSQNPEGTWRGEPVSFIPGYSTALIQAKSDHEFAIDLTYSLGSYRDPIGIHASTTDKRTGISTTGDHATVQRVSDIPNLAGTVVVGW